MDYGRSVHYLDAMLAIEDDGRISSDLFTKPTDSHQYLLPSSTTLPTFTNTSLMDWPCGFVKSFHPMIGLELDWRN